MHLRETSGALSRIKFSNTGVANKYFEVGASNNAANNFSAYSVSFFDGTNYKSRFLIYGDGKTSINNMHAPLTTFHVMDDNATSPGIAAEGFGFSGQINLTRNNPLGVSPTYTRGAVFGGQEIGKINFSAYDGTGYGDGAKIYAKASENVSNTSKGTDLFFATVPNGTTANTDKMRINNDGNIGIGVNPLRAKLEMNMLGSAQSSAIFGGDSWGVSLYHNYPGIGFGSYFDGSSFKSINASGYGANIIFDPFSSGDYIFYSTDVTSPTADAVQVMRERLRLARSGAIGVGPTSDFGTSGQVLVSNGPGSAPNWQALTAPAAAWTSTLGNTYLVNSGDKVGIGTSTPSESLDVNGNINIPVSTSSVGVIKMAGANFISAPGSDNLFVGKSSGNIATTGFNNVAFGNNTLQNLASGANNVGLGYQVMQVIGSGSQNIAIGTNALSSINSGNNNTALGFQAGNVITNGANNLFLGYNTNANGASLTNASAIGSLARVDASNSMVLGSINGINGAIASTKIGIGITAPTAQLHVVNGSSTGEGMFVDNASNTHGIRVFQAGIGDGFYAHINNAGAGAGFDGLTNSNGAFYKGQNTGSGGVADFTINNASNNSPVISAVTSGKGSAIYAVNTGSLNATGYFSNSSGNALEVLSSNGIGVLATVASASAAIDVTNNSTGAGIHVKKSATATSGNAGRFEILNAGNSADGIFVETKGVGAAIHAVGSNTTTGTAGLFDGNVITNGNVTIPATKNYKYATPKTDYNSVSALSFNTEGAYNRSNISGGVYIVDGTAGTQGNLYAGVNLPNGAVVTGVDAYVLDNDGLAGRDIAYVQLWRQDGAVGTGFGNVINMAQTPGTSVTSSAIVKLSTTAISNSTIDNSLYTYYLRVGSVQAAPNLILFKVVITYTITNVD
jgi:hypothetical protein